MPHLVQKLRREDYTPPAWTVPHLELLLDLDPEETHVEARLSLRRQGDPKEALLLNGVEQQLDRVEADGRELPAECLEYDPEKGLLRVARLPGSCELRVFSRCRPSENTALEGLYVSRNLLVTQCESLGFRRIAFFPDRPDILSTMKVTLRADKRRFPVLLSNGDPAGERDLQDGRHEAVWVDPFPKPCYLFALVAGDLEFLEDHFVTRSGRRVTLRIYAEGQALGKCRHALDSLSKSMAWDEKVYGLEYAIDRFNIVAVADFNAGAMENTSLNVYNAAALLASRETTPDDRLLYVERVVAHEYFHNFSGNRVTLRDWFEVTLKEGLTILRDQEFTADTHSRAQKRIFDAQYLREHQFPEDAGPLAHAIRPDEVADIDNFYTVTVYEKGAEVLRMLHTMIGGAAWQKAMSLYFSRFDGQAVTCEHLLALVEESAGIDLEQFRRWYSRPGTPRLYCRREWKAEQGVLELHLEQRMADHQGGAELPPLVIPLRLGFFDREGRELALPGIDEAADGGSLHVMREAKECLRIEGLPRGEEPPVPSLLRNFSAPVLLQDDLRREEQELLLACDTDPVNRWQIGQELLGAWTLKGMEALQQGERPLLDEGIARGLRVVLHDRELDHGLKARFLALPTAAALGARLQELDPLALEKARLDCTRLLAEALRPELEQLYTELAVVEAWAFNVEQHGRRSLRNSALNLLARSARPRDIDRCRKQYRDADNMSDRQAAFSVLLNLELEDHEELCAGFYERFRDHAEVVDVWLALQAGSRLPGARERITKLMRHESWVPTNPNRVRALLRTFASNGLAFHEEGEAGYRWFAGQVAEVARINAYVAANLARYLSGFKRFGESYRQAMRAAVEELHGTPDLPSKVKEITDLALR